MNLGKLAATLPLPFLDARANVELAVRCEKEWGYEAIWLAETNGHESFALAAAIALATERVGIGTAIVPVYNRTPAVLAMARIEKKIPARHGSLWKKNNCLL